MNERFWFSRCPVPTASGLAFRLGWTGDAFAAHGHTISALEDAHPTLAARHVDHALVGLFREGGSVPALVARSQGADTRLVGLTWTDERQVIMVRDDDPAGSASDLAGRRIALPARGPGPGGEVMRAMALQGFRGALSIVGLGFDDVESVRVPEAPADIGFNRPSSAAWTGIGAVAAREADAVYLKGALAVAAAQRDGLRVLVDLDRHPDPSVRVNNGTPRPITVDARTVQEHPDLVAAFLGATLRAAAWAAEHPDAAADLVAAEVGATRDDVADVHGQALHRQFEPALSADRLELLAQQHDFLLTHGFLPRPIDLDAWVAPEPIALASQAVGT